MELRYPDIALCMNVFDKLSAEKISETHQKI